MNRAVRLATTLLLSLSFGGTPLHPAEHPVFVILWFDAEDYLLPADDDATKRLCDLLTARSVRATFKLVGEKARVIERRGRSDVLAALRKHDIGYHANFHSVHPTPAEYLAECGWSDGVAEFVRREGGGAADVRRILGVERLSCYGQPGSSWAPQTLGGLDGIVATPHGVPCYVDEGSHVGISEAPFWYCGALTVYKMGSNVTRMDLHREEALAEATDRFGKIHARLRSQGGGLVSVFYHPCEWVHAEFWDGVNFSRGSNPPREEWKPPRQLPPEKTEAAFARFERYVDFMRSLPGVKFVTASDLPELYPDPLRPSAIDAAAIEPLARRVAEMGLVDFLQDAQGRFHSPADLLTELIEFLGGAIDEKKPPGRLRLSAVLGPSEPPPKTEVDSLDWPAFRDALVDARAAIRARRQIPSPVFAGVKKIAPADFLVACARAAVRVIDSAKAGKPLFPERIEVPSGTAVATEKHVAQDTPGLFGGWIIHKEGFRAPRIMEQARLQAWTLKPAQLLPNAR